MVDSSTETVLPSCPVYEVATPQAAASSCSARVASAFIVVYCAGGVGCSPRETRAFSVPVQKRKVGNGVTK